MEVFCWNGWSRRSGGAPATLVRLEGRLLTFLRRADRLVKVLGELVDPDAVQDARAAVFRRR